MKIKETDISKIKVLDWFDEDISNRINKFNKDVDSLDKSISNKLLEKVESKKALLDGTDLEIKKAIKFLTSMNELDIFYATQIRNLLLEKELVLKGTGSSVTKHAGVISKEIKNREEQIKNVHEQANIKVANINYVINTDEMVKNKRLYMRSLMDTARYKLSEREQDNLKELETFLSNIG